MQSPIPWNNLAPIATTKNVTSFWIKEVAPKTIVAKI